MRKRDEALRLKVSQSQPGEEWNEIEETDALEEWVGDLKVRLDAAVAAGPQMAERGLVTREGAKVMF